MPSEPYVDGLNLEFMSEPSNHFQNETASYTVQLPLPGVVDPTLGGHGTTGEAQPLERFLLDQQRSFNTYGQSPTQLTPTLQYPSVLAQPHGLGNSPSSQYQHSSACSVPSPRTESDMLQDGPYAAITPPGMKSPLVRAVCDPLDRQFDLVGITSHNNQYVNPSKLLPNHVSLADCRYMGDKMDFTLDAGPILDTVYMQYEDSLNINLHLGSPASEYPDPELMEEVIVASPIPEEEDGEEDEDYKPKSSRRMSRHSGSPKNKGRGRPRGSTTTTQSKVVKAYPKSRPVPAKSSSSASVGLHPCSQCPNMYFNNGATLQKHVRREHKRTFPCIFHFAGCNDAFASKNEWKRHIATQHLNTCFWLCTHDACGKDENGNGHPFKSGRPFKRKDLFTQHIRRMHVDLCPAEPIRSSKNQNPDAERQIQRLQDHACHKRCDTPEFMRCPGEECYKEFRGEKAWDEYLEHIASDHLDPSGKNRSPPVQFGGPGDQVFTAWASSAQVNVIRRTRTGWLLCNSFKDLAIVRKEV